MKSFEELVEVVARLRGEGGCPWDREQTHATLKTTCIEEAAEVICGINILEKTGNASNLCEELGDLLLQVVMQARIAEEEGLFTIDDVNRAITEKMIRRHPHVFGEVTVSDTGEVLKNWEEIKKLEKKGKIDDDPYIYDAFDESVALIERARQRKFEKRRKAAEEKND
ncbi:MAG: MazG family protein [Lachnospiraceae bacterium]|nr:MazG family protein [Lachnospiraceae bacterium]